MVLYIIVVAVDYTKTTYLKFSFTKFNKHSVDAMFRERLHVHYM